ncbi:hypothetical protein GPUN_0688 [Glaciecola punicea ACAM 611]|uniref:Uncharacterized protein n=1 Tax=Glaciecola punicea ACAM 611 TaxID=1121923 RepID=H5T951_9ALTE|nr:hypothetical protein GPUN_0688 [Glaciecola punicea ACAM 611]
MLTALLAPKKRWANMPTFSFNSQSIISNFILPTIQVADNEP